MNWRSQIQDLLRRKEGRNSRELVLEPARFGLGHLPSRLQPDATVKSVCGFCSTGCSLNVHLNRQQPINLTPDEEYPVNLGMACPKGWESLAPMASSTRALYPRLGRLGGKFSRIDWSRAASHFADRMKSIMKQYGPESVAFLSTGQIPTEEMALLGSVAKFGMGFIHGDANTRQCMATAATAYKESYGFDAPPFTYADFEESDVLVFVGANPCIAHPILWERVLANKRKPQIVVIDPRTTETAMAATLHLKIQPKSDLTLLYTIAKLVAEAGHLDLPFIDRHTSGFQEFLAHISTYTKERCAVETGLTTAQIETFGRLVHPQNRVSFWWTMGVNQSHEGTRTAQALVNLSLMTGNIGKPGTGANSITGQVNAMGSRLFSNTTGLLGGRKFDDPKHRGEVSHILGIDSARIPLQNSLPYHKILEGAEQGKIRGLWIIATNPAHSWINSPQFARLRQKLDFLCVQDIYEDTETARTADLFLPAAGWGEKEGTVINSERRIGNFRKFRRSPGESLADFHIFRLLAEAWGCADMFRSWTSPAAAFGIMKELSRGLPFDFSGIKDYAHIEQNGGIQWPHPEGAPPPARERRLFEDGNFYHVDQRARFVFSDVRAPAENVDDEYPLVLLTGRGTSAQWHTQTKTSRSEVLRKLYPEKAYAEIHPDDAERIGLKDSAPVTVSTRRGSVQVQAVLTPTVEKGQIFMPMHYPETNGLTHAEFDPHSHQPSYKYCAARISRVGA